MSDNAEVGGLVEYLNLFSNHSKKSISLAIIYQSRYWLIITGSVHKWDWIASFTIKEIWIMGSKRCFSLIFWKPVTYESYSYNSEGFQNVVVLNYWYCRNFISYWVNWYFGRWNWLLIGISGRYNESPKATFFKYVQNIQGVLWRLPYLKKLR